jgi:hypothetical protein
MFISKEKVLDYLLVGYIHLSKKDYSFFYNISLLIKDKKCLTENQTKLFDKLIVKYQKQIKKFGYDSNILLTLPWTSEVLESKLEYLQARVFILNNNIIIKSPFNSQFITNFKKIALQQFEWDKNSKQYVAPFSTYNLKIATEFIPKYFDNYVFSDDVKTLLEGITLYENAKFWTPTLIKVGNSFYIVAMNEHLYNATKDIALNDDHKTLFLLSQYGVEIDESVTQQNQKLLFAGNFMNTIDIEYLGTLVLMLKELDIETVFTARDIIHNKQISNEIKLAFLEKGINCKPFTNENKHRGILLKGTTFYSGPFQGVTKVITITNSRPVKIR